MDFEELVEWFFDLLGNILDFIKSLKLGERIGILTIPLSVLLSLCVITEYFIRDGYVAIFDGLFLVWILTIILAFLVDNDNFIIGLEKIIGEK